MAAVQGSKLPKKEADLFRNLVDCYEKKNYKKGLKTADTILKKFPNSGETQAMKGIILNSMGKKEEAYELVKAGVKNDLRSHVCWHVYGLLYRSDNNYKEAIKCYLNALRIDPGNQNILRDLSWLQMQMRDAQGFLSTRRKILELKSTARASWVAFAVSNYCVDQYSAAFEVLNKYHDNVSEKGDAYEESELFLFQVLCLQKEKKFLEAVEHLERHKAKIVDKLSWKIRHAELLTLQGLFEDATVEWTQLLQDQPDNFQLHRGIQAALLRFDEKCCVEAFALKSLRLPCNAFVLSETERDNLFQWYSQQTVRSRSMELIRLSLADKKPHFREALHAFIKKNLQSGVPSLCQDVLSLAVIVDPLQPARTVHVKDAREVQAHPIVALALELTNALLVELQDEPVGVLWSHYLKAHLLEMSGDVRGALVSIEQAIAHTPTAIDMLAKRARLKKKLGEVAEAAVVMDECRAVDLQDRYLNNKATKYLLRADEVSQAMNTIAMFTKHEGDPQKTLFDLQCSWYELELAESYARQKKWGLALKKFHAIRAHFIEQYDDMFDFHGYCIRKSTLRAYLEMMDVQDSSFAHKNFQRALRGVLKIYLHLLDCPEDIDGLGHLSPADRKKERAKQKKKKQAKDEAKSSESLGEDSKPDTDPEGEGLLHKDFLAEAGIWCSELRNRLALCDCDTLALIAEIMMRRGKQLQAVRALRLGLAKSPEHPSLVTTLVKYALRLKNKKMTNVNVSVMSFIKEEVCDMLKSESFTSVGEFVDGFVLKAQTSGSLMDVLGAIKCLQLVDKNNVSKILEAIACVDFAKIKGANIQNILEFLKYLQSNFEDESIWKPVWLSAQALFPTADYFQGKVADDKTDTL